MKHTGFSIKRIDREAGSSASVASVTNPSPQTNSRSSRSGEKADARAPAIISRDTREDLRGRCSPSPGHVVPVPHLDRGLFGTTPRGSRPKARGASRLLFLCDHQRPVRRARRAERRAQKKSRVFIGFVGFVDTGVAHGSIHRHAGKRSFLCRDQFRAAFGERDARDRLGVARQNLPVAVY